MRILQVNTFDRGGGAEAVVSRLHGAYRRAGHEARLAVKRLRAPVEGAFEVPEAAGHGAWGRAWLGLAGRVEAMPSAVPGARAAAALARRIARPRAAVERRLGREDFRFPSTPLLPRLAEDPDVIQCHNLHGGYFDLGALAPLSRRRPVVLTLHDCWLFTGHCAHPFGCERWRQGCGSCPDLAIYPAVARDATAFNWQRKSDVHAAGRFRVATPSRWLMERVRESMLMPGVVETRVIENGIDDAFFAPGDREEARRALGLETDAHVLLFVANTVRGNEWKDFPTLRRAVELAASREGAGRIELLVLGEGGGDEAVGGARVRFVPFEPEPALVARHYRAADVYLHAARAETFSLTIAEAMASGVPVVATAVGAVPERIRSLTDHDASQATGILTVPGDADGMARAVATLLADAALRRTLGANAAADAARRYRIETQARAYLDWFEEVRA